MIKTFLTFIQNIIFVAVDSGNF